MMHHVSLKVDRPAFERTVEFYRNFFGFELERDLGKAAMLRQGSVRLEILQMDGKRPEPGVIDHLAFAVDDVDAMTARMREAGYRVTREPGEHIFECANPYRVYIAFLEGPAGESVELFSEEK